MGEEPYEESNKEKREGSDSTDDQSNGSRHVLVSFLRPWARPADAEREYGVHLTDPPPAGCYDAIVLAVAHRQFRELGSKGIRAFGKPRCVLYDVKHVLPAGAVDGRL